MTMRRFARAEVGMTLIETLVTVVVLTGGLLTTLSVFSSMGSATYKAQRKVVLVSLAQREMERLRVLPYDKIGLSGPVHASAATKAPLPANVMAGGLVGGGVVDPGPTRFGPDEPGSLRIESVSGVIYRYVTWRSQPCPAVNTSVATQLSTELGQAQSTVAAAVGDLCPGSHQTKRITIVVVSSDIVKHGGPARLSTVVVDPASSVLAAGGYDGLQVNAQPVVNQATGGSPATPSSVYANVTSQALHLTDTPCTQSTRAEPDSAGHSSHDTSRAVAVGTDRCSTGSVAADLMTLTPPTGLLTAPLPDLSNEVSRPAVGGLALVRDDRVGTCADTGYAPSEAGRRRRSIHTWASKAPAANYITAETAGRATLTFWTQTTSATPLAGRLCVTVWRASNGQVLGTSDYRLPVWPSSPTQLAIAFDLTHAVIPAGDRLMVTLRTPGDSQADLLMLYDHAGYPSSLGITTKTGSGLL